MTETADLGRLAGEHVTLRPATFANVKRLVEIRATPQVRARWRGEDIETEVREAIEDDELHLLVIEHDGEVIGAIQWATESDPDYHHASVDMFLDPSIHGRGLGTDAARTLCRYLLGDGGFHRLTIDPAADNLAAIRCYQNVGFRTVGLMRRYERDLDGTWHDGTLMDLLAEDLVSADAEAPIGLTAGAYDRSNTVSQLRLVVEVDDFDDVVAFYSDGLGLAQQAAFEGDNGARVVIFDAGRATLEFANHAQAEMIDHVEVGRRTSPKFRVAFEVSDTTAVTQRLVAAGADLIADGRVTPWRSLNSRLAAPGDVQLTLFQELDPLQQRAGGETGVDFIADDA